MLRLPEVATHWAANGKKVGPGPRNAKKVLKAEPPMANSNPIDAERKVRTRDFIAHGFELCQ